MRFRPTVLVTRPAEGAARFAAAFRARFGADWPVVISPLTAIVPTGTPLPAAEILVFTSERGVVLRGDGRPAYCVGARTAQAAQAAGFRAIEGPGDARGLCALIVAQHPAGRILHARGSESAWPVTETLNRAGLRASEAIVYRQEDLVLSAVAIDILMRPEPILLPLFSPRGAARFRAAAGETRAAILGAAISEATAHACAGFARLEIAPSPDQNGVLDAMTRLLQDQAG